MSNHAKGTFDVKVIPQPAADAAGGPFAHHFLDKKFQGALEATSLGTMMSFGSPSGGGAGYVALELVTGTLDGRRGTFVLQHSGSMQGKDMTLIINVVPDSGTDQLAGLAGTFTIVIEGKAHFYDLEYTFKNAAR